MTAQLNKALLCIAALLMSCAASADTTTPTGLWRTIDDTTGNGRSLIRITERNGVFEGIVEQILTRLPEDDPEYLCRACKGERKDKPVIGMTILWGLKKDGNQYAGGEILDPNDGKIYRAKMLLLENGKKLEVRGFIGISLIGRSQTWLREP